MKRIIAALALSIALVGCNSDVVVETNNGTVNLGEVTSQYATVRAIGEVASKDTTIDMGSTPISEVSSTFRKNWKGGSDETDLIKHTMILTFATEVTYKGTKNSAELHRATNKITCATGETLAQCLIKIDEVQALILKEYKEKFTYLK